MGCCTSSIIALQNDMSSMTPLWNTPIYIFKRCQIQMISECKNIIENHIDNKQNVYKMLILLYVTGVYKNMDLYSRNAKFKSIFDNNTQNDSCSNSEIYNRLLQMCDTFNYSSTINNITYNSANSYKCSKEDLISYKTERYIFDGINFTGHDNSV